uniref:AMP-dependent synthetase/ligase domain-containing protein n=1 Tax=Euplotes crassus TaxID=5936 RepID=A0A7S3KDD5_EUPCR|mmetsp:Transcript_21848/g.21588  ORF Transcript_21848/g.21588 Transcript_21848/m.21588 type:complete len:213 (+) Transcript_21848:562-1200(+)
MKLVDVPEMDYLSTDMRNGENYPRGEICFKGGGAFQGYFKEPAKTEETIDKDGWVHTGDIGEIQPDGALRIIDRKKNIFKLSQGEYIAAEKLELIFVKTPLIAQIFVYGDSLQSFLVAIVVPDNEYVDKNYSPGYSSSSEYLQEVNDWFKECREEHKLNGLEIPKKLHVTNEEFNIDDGTLTPTFKLVRGVAKKKFLSQIKEMYGGAKLQGE